MSVSQAVFSESVPIAVDRSAYDTLVGVDWSPEHVQDDVVASIDSIPALRGCSWDHILRQFSEHWAVKFFWVGRHEFGRVTVSCTFEEYTWDRILWKCNV